MSNKRRRSSKKKHEVPLTEDMLNELNKASLGHHGYMMHSGSGGAVAYDNYGQDPDEFYDMEDIWSNDQKYHGGQHRYKVIICENLSDRRHGARLLSKKCTITFCVLLPCYVERKPR